MAELIALPPGYRTTVSALLPNVGAGLPFIVQEEMACGTPTMAGEKASAGHLNHRHRLFVENVGTGDTAGRWIWRLTKLLDPPDRLSERRNEVAKFASPPSPLQTAVGAYGELLDSVLAACKR